MCCCRTFDHRAVDSASSPDRVPSVVQANQIEVVDDQANVVVVIGSKNVNGVPWGNITTCD